ncbi:MAG: DMT family transporter [Bacteroidales bacterium]|nr:DMT family transporter [Bacteroidales bacterium]
MSTNRFYTYGSAILSMLFWGMSFVWTAIALEDYQPVTIITLRLAISILILFAWLKLTGKLRRIKREHYKLFIISSLFNPFFYFLGENYGVMYTSPTISAVMIALIPLFVPIFAFFALREKLPALNILGLITSFAGVMVMLLNKQLSFETSPIGIGALMFAVLTAVGYAIYLKKLSGFYSPILIIAVQNLLGFLYFLPIFLIFDWHSFLSVSPDFKLISSIVALAVLCSSLAFIGFTIATRELGVGRTNVFANLIPVFTGIFSYIVIGETLDKQKIIGILIVVTGLFLSQLGKKTLGPMNRF